MEDDESLGEPHGQAPAFVSEAQVHVVGLAEHGQAVPSQLQHRRPVQVDLAVVDEQHAGGAGAREREVVAAHGEPHGPH